MKKFMIPAEVYSRVSGYFRPVNQWNFGKQDEFTNRKMLKIDKISTDDQKIPTENSKI